MRKEWTVVSNSGQQAVLMCGEERIEVRRPEGSFSVRMFMKMVPGGLVKDGLLELFENHEGPLKSPSLH
jgi:hypothetical protein